MTVRTHLIIYSLLIFIISLSRHSLCPSVLPFDDSLPNYINIMTWLTQRPLYFLYDSFIDFYARQLYRQVLLRARISYGNSVCPCVRPSVRHDPVWIQGQVR